MIVMQKTPKGGLLIVLSLNEIQRFDFNGWNNE